MLKIEERYAYTEGCRKARIIIKTIAFNDFKNLENALEAKQNYLYLLKTELNYNEDNETYVETMGMIATLADEIKKQNP